LTVGTAISEYDCDQGSDERVFNVESKLATIIARLMHFHDDIVQGAPAGVLTRYSTQASLPPGVRPGLAALATTATAR